MSKNIVFEKDAILNQWEKTDYFINDVGTTTEGKKLN